MKRTTVLHLAVASLLSAQVAQANDVNSIPSPLLGFHISVDPDCNDAHREQTGSTIPLGKCVKYFKYNAIQAMFDWMNLYSDLARRRNQNYNPGYNMAPQNNIKAYSGVGIGHTGQGSACNAPFFEGACDESAMSYKVFTGARFNQLLGAELTYVDHGEAAMNGNVGSQSVASKNRISGYQLTGVGYLPLAPATMPSFDIIGKAGFLFWERETDIEIDDLDQYSDDGVSGLLGIGAQYQFHPNMLMRGEWEHIFGSGANSSFETDIDNYSMSLMYYTM